jgi:hypothetical protein
MSFDPPANRSNTAEIKVRQSDHGGLSPADELVKDKEFELKLPDAYVNGRLVTFPPVKFINRQISYYAPPCMK